ncbi:MAG: phage integrase N-terminal SAM-like domain-containing protein [Chloroflexi bacterium]|nr:phage integrase N-terminal SAM-like domain-containing protein [Chloroflexota bacterium]
MTSSPFLNQIRRVMRFKHMSFSTEGSYPYYMKQFILFHNKRHPKDMGVDEIQAYLPHLAVENKPPLQPRRWPYPLCSFVSPCAQNTIVRHRGH